MVINAVAVEAIVVAVEKQYIDELKDDYVGYNNQTIKTMVLQLRTWFVITKIENVSIKAHFHALWSDTPNSHITTFARQIDRRQIECSNHGFTITDDDKFVHFIQKMYVCGLFEARFLDDWGKKTTKTWKVTLPLLTTKLNKERRTLEHQHRANTFESSHFPRKRGVAGSFGESMETTSN